FKVNIAHRYPTRSNTRRLALISDFPTTDETNGDSFFQEVDVGLQRHANLSPIVSPLFRPSELPETPPTDYYNSLALTTPPTTPPNTPFISPLITPPPTPVSFPFPQQIIQTSQIHLNSSAPTMTQPAFIMPMRNE